MKKLIGCLRQCLKPIKNNPSIFLYWGEIPLKLPDDIICDITPKPHSNINCYTRELGQFKLYILKISYSDLMTKLQPWFKELRQDPKLKYKKLTLIEMGNYAIINDNTLENWIASCVEAL